MSLEDAKRQKHENGTKRLSPHWHFRFDEISVPSDSPMIGKPFGDIKGGAGGCPLVVAVVAGTDAYELDPPIARPVRAGDRLVILGETEALGGLRKLVHS